MLHNSFQKRGIAASTSFMYMWAELDGIVTASLFVSFFKIIEKMTFRADNILAEVFPRSMFIHVAVHQINRRWKCQCNSFNKD